ncbi:NAD(P)-binding protein [Rhizodiscina lignyota]|uniref:NAD(P)-binding protein n=1 Tax=Rhizodiscina lignyota TaxID=1504668 RepID=A0A9P4M920_9PEZI|nr:NAD(P)-binding protein [Rhizodiscina lignyota]
MPREIKNVVIVGASGTLGPPILSALKSTTLNVAVISRPDSSATFPSDTKVIKSDTSYDSLLAAFRSHSTDAVICLVGGRALKEQFSMIDAAVDAGVARFVPSEFGANTADERVRDLVTMTYKQRKEVTEYLQKKSEEKGGEFGWTGVVSGPFFDWGLETGFLGFDIPNRHAKILDSGTVPFATTNLEDVGKCLANILTNHSMLESTANQYIYIATYVCRQKTLLSVLEKITGEPWKVEREHSKQVISKFKEKLLGGDIAAQLPLVKVAGWGERELGDFTQIDGGLWNEKLGMKPAETGIEALEADVRRIVQNVKGEATYYTP